MSLQLPTILSPPTPCTPVPALTVSPQVRSRSCRSPFPGRLPFWASPSPSRLANASGRIEFIIFLIMDWSFASGCSPPRLSATQFPSATDSQCSVRWGLPPHCWCALSGALGEASRFASLNPDGSPGSVHRGMRGGALKYAGTLLAGPGLSSVKPEYCLEIAIAVDLKRQPYFLTRCPIFLIPKRGKLVRRFFWHWYASWQSLAIVRCQEPFHQPGKFYR